MVRLEVSVRGTCGVVSVNVETVPYYINQGSIDYVL